MYNPDQRRTSMTQNYTCTKADRQMAFSQASGDGYLMVPNQLRGFHNTRSEEVEIASIRPRKSKRNTRISRMSSKTAYRFYGFIDDAPRPVCACGCRMQIHQSYNVDLIHLPFGGKPTVVTFEKTQYRCPECGATSTLPVPFQADGHRITNELKELINHYLSLGEFTLTDVALITGVNINAIKQIDKERLLDAYTEPDPDAPGKRRLKKPTEYSRHISIDEFKLHEGHKFATHIIDLDTGRVLYIAAGKKKDVVFDFMKLVGDKWMSHVEAVAMDMNSDFQEAFEDKCPWIMVVFDHFHLVKNFNDGVVAEVRKDEQERLKKEGNPEAAKMLKGMRKILVASDSTLQKHDQEAREGKVCRKGSDIFKTTDYKHSHDDYVARREALLEENNLLFTADMVRQMMDEAYQSKDAATMIEKFTDIIDNCRGTHNKHFEWFARLVENHFQGITNYGYCNISSGKMEGTNNHIKVLRRKHYGLPDDEYFFLKVIDMSYNPTRRV